MRRRCRLALSVAIVAALAALAAPAAHAEEVRVTSFDGTEIVVNFFRAEGLGAGERAPTVLVGPGFSSPGEEDPNSESSAAIGSVGLGPLRGAGYNVATFDPRGFGNSGGEAKIDSPDFEARDVKRIISYVASRDDTELDSPGDPVVGMSGASYGGGIQFVTAAIDPRVDAITPTIAWHTLVRSLFTRGDVKAGWGSALCGLGQVNGLAPGLISPGGFENGTVDDHVTSACVEGTSTGEVSREDVEWFRDRGPHGLVGDIETPTLMIQGTVDTLFTLQEAIDNYELMEPTGVPLRMMWFCGGHGACLTGGGEAGRIERRVIAWFDRWLRDERSAPVGPGFEWVADDDRWRTADRFPLPRTGSLRGRGSGTLALSAAGSSGALVLATPVQAGAFDVPIEPARREAELLGAPEVELTYSGNALPDERTHVYGQIVDEQRNIVVGNQATPIRLTLDGTRRTVETTLAPIAAHATPGDRYRLQIVPSTTLYYPQGSAGAVEIERASVRLPVRGAAAGGGDGPGDGDDPGGGAGDDPDAGRGGSEGDRDSDGAEDSASGASGSSVEPAATFGSSSGDAGDRRSLPFTGLALGLLSALGAGMAALGLIVRRRGDRL